MKKMILMLLIIIGLLIIPLTSFARITKVTKFWDNEGNLTIKVRHTGPVLTISYTDYKGSSYDQRRLKGNEWEVRKAYQLIKAHTKGWTPEEFLLEEWDSGRYKCRDSYKGTFKVEKDDRSASKFGWKDAKLWQLFYGEMLIKEARDRYQWGLEADAKLVGYREEGTLSSGLTQYITVEFGYQFEDKVDHGVSGRMFDVKLTSDFTDHKKEIEGINLPYGKRARVIFKFVHERKQSRMAVKLISEFRIFIYSVYEETLPIYSDKWSLVPLNSEIEGDWGDWDFRDGKRYARKIIDKKKVRTRLNVGYEPFDVKDVQEEPTVEIR